MARNPCTGQAIGHNTAPQFVVTWLDANVAGPLKVAAPGEHAAVLTRKAGP
jgi:hypothetical protein